MLELEILKMAKNSSDKGLLKKLSDHNSSMVRRIVAKNRFTPKSILQKLSYDPVMNVSFMAVHNSNNTVNRSFEEVHPCVSCTTDELQMNCSNCHTLNSYRNK